MVHGIRRRRRQLGVSALHEVLDEAVFGECAEVVESGTAAVDVCGLVASVD